MAIKRIMLVRPGETDWNLTGRWQGWVAIPLNEDGKQQVVRLAGFMRNFGVSEIISSDTRRALDTSAILGEHLGLEPLVDERWRERHIGHWQGMILPEVRAWYPKEYQLMLDNLDDYRISGGGESRNDVRRRVKAGFDAVVEKWQDDLSNITVGIVTHTTAIRVLLETIMPSVDLKTAEFGNSSVTTVGLTAEGDWKIITLNDLAHLEGMPARHMPEVEYDK